VQFASVYFMLFLSVAVVGYFLLPGQRSRTIWLLAASYVFYYSLSASWTVVLVAVTAIGFGFGLLLERLRPTVPGGPMPRRLRLVLSAGIVLAVGTLVVFKYAGFIGVLADDLLRAFGSNASTPVLALALPVGISFWTFQTIAYLVDVARGRLQAERSPVRYALFVSFFPHVTAGPIARGGQLLPQFAERRRFSFEGMRSGLLLLGWGFLKKLLIADSLSVFVAVVFGNPQAFGDSSLVLAAASVAFALQIYFDFAGYTDIARGTARLFGVDLMRNFDRPYAARSIKEFWRRWHMTLMAWLRDYVYIPLGGSRVPKARRYANILVVFAISGLWHGAGLTFLFWGLLNGAYQILGEVLAPLRDRLTAVLHIPREGRLRHAIQTVTTFVLVTIGWVFFRAESLADAFFIISRMFVPTFGSEGAAALARLGLSYPALALAGLAAIAVLVVEWVASRVDLPARLCRAPLVVRWVAYQSLILAVVVFGQYGPGVTATDFVYFRF